ncbi:MAG: Rrf2 family transcriptional regulator [Paludibacter sp.]|nr:Rrf2 family transcriptional regulator [Paludibacter sp.]
MNAINFIAFKLFTIYLQKYFFNMRVNSKIRYGLRTIIEIAISTDPDGVLQKEIAKSQHISLKYLDPIISSLKLKGLITNSRGRGSGYKLTREAKDINMYDIYTAFEPIVIIECINNLGYCDRASHNCKGRSYWNEFRNEITNLMLKKNLEQIIQDTYYECKDLIVQQ